MINDPSPYMPPADPKEVVTVAEKIAKMHYKRNEWSGCYGSRWDTLPGPERDRRITEAQEWITAANVAGFLVVRPA